MKRLTAKHLKQLCQPAKKPRCKEPCKPAGAPSRLRPAIQNPQSKIQNLLTPGLGLGMGMS